MEIFLFSVGIIVILLITLFRSFNNQKNLKVALQKEREQYKKLLSQKKSSEVITGQIAEQLAPFLKVFKHNPKQAHFLGQPVDYIIFGDETVTFVEVKSGNSTLSKKQRTIRDNILAGRVAWEVIRIK